MLLQLNSTLYLQTHAIFAISMKKAYVLLELKNNESNRAKRLFIMFTVSCLLDGIQ